jgi:hypothetical protein
MATLNSGMLNPIASSSVNQLDQTNRFGQLPADMNQFLPQDMNNLQLSSIQGSTSSRGLRTGQEAPDSTLDDMPRRILDMINTGRQLSQTLINAGRRAEGVQLQEELNRLTRAGSSIGVNSFARTRAFAALQDAARAGRGVREARELADRFSRESQSLGQLAQVEGQRFGQAMQQASFRAQEDERVASSYDNQMNLGFRYSQPEQQAQQSQFGQQSMFNGSAQMDAMRADAQARMAALSAENTARMNNKPQQTVSKYVSPWSGNVAVSGPGTVSGTGIAGAERKPYGPGGGNSAPSAGFGVSSLISPRVQPGRPTQNFAVPESDKPTVFSGSAK